MKTTEKMKFFYFAGKKLLEKLKNGDSINPITIKKAFKEVGGKAAINTQEIMALTYFTKGITMDSPSSNMGYYESLGFTLSHVAHQGLINHPRFTKIVLDKANASNFLEHPTQKNGMSMTEAFCIAGFNMGMTGNKIATFETQYSKIA